MIEKRKKKIEADESINVKSAMKENENENKATCRCLLLFFLLLLLFLPSSFLCLPSVFFDQDSFASYWNVVRLCKDQINDVAKEREREKNKVKVFKV